MAKTKTKKCRCRKCGRKYTAKAGVRYGFKGGRLVRIGKSKPLCIGECDACFNKTVDRWLDAEMG